VVVRDVLAELSLELLGEIIHHSVIEILTTKMGITSGGLDLKDALLDGQKRDIEGSTSKIEDKNILLGTLLVKAIGNGGGSGLVDDTKDVKARDDTSILGCLALRVVEVSRHGDDGILDFTAKVSLGNLLHLDEDHGRDLLGRESLVFSLELDLDQGLAGRAGLDLEWPVLHVALDGGILEFAANKTLGIENSVGGVHSDLILSSISNQTLLVIESNIGRGGSISLIVGNDFHTIILPYTNTTVCGTKIDTHRCSFNACHV